MIKSVEVKPGCIACKTCQGICPQVFRVEGTSQVIGYDFEKYRQALLRAEKMCPVNVIKVDRDDTEETGDIFAHVTLTQYADLTPDVREFCFSTAWFSALPGQYVSLRMRDGAGEFKRSYSIVESSENSFKLCIKIVPDGRGGRVLSRLSVGDQVMASPAVGGFVLRDTPLPKVFIATGTGLAPMIAMLSATPNTVPKTVIFGVRREEDLFYLDTLRSYSNIRIVTTLSSPRGTWLGQKWRVTEYLDLVPPDAEVYLCGSPDMVESVREGLRARGHSESLVSAEEYVDQSLAPASDERSWFHRAWFDGEVPGIRPMQYALFSASAAVPILWYLGGFTPMLWDWSWYAVTLLMLIRPLADLFPRVMFFRSLLPLRQGLGILSASVVATNAWFAYIPNASDFLSTYFSVSHWAFSNRAFFAHGAELAGFVLLITSNEMSRKLLGPWWKRIQRLSYVYFFFAGVYLLYIGKTIVFPSMVLVAILWLAAHLKNRFTSPS